MTTASPTILRGLLSYYPTLTTRERAHMIMRWRLCPMRRIVALVPPEGSVIDLGCGHGLFSLLIALAHPQQQITGIDLDADKIALAQTLHAPNLQFRAGDITAQTDLPSAHAITILDVLYLIPYEAQESLLALCADRLSVNGSILLKEAAESPRWKAALNTLEETVVVRALGITATGDGDARFYFRTRAEWQGLFERLGFSVATRMLDRGYYHPHVVFHARKR